MKYQTNLDTHSPGCIYLNGTVYQNIHSLDNISKYVKEHFPQGYSKSDDPNNKAFKKICMEKPIFRANFPQVRFFSIFQDLHKVHVTQIIDQYYL